MGACLGIMHLFKILIRRNGDKTKPTASMMPGVVMGMLYPGYGRHLDGAITNGRKMRTFSVEE